MEFLREKALIKRKLDALNRDKKYKVKLQQLVLIDGEWQKGRVTYLMEEDYILSVGNIYTTLEKATAFDFESLERELINVVSQVKSLEILEIIEA